MSILEWLQKQYLFIAIILLPLLLINAQDEQLEESQAGFRPGKYVPELHGAALGKYVPDYRGIYQHIHIPYDGGYGDRGEKYEHDLSGIFKRPFALSMKDHLRFMIDFNYNGSGWQVIQFEWVRDGDEDRQYNYVKENRLWEPHSAGYDYSIGGSGKTMTYDETNVHVTGEYVTNDDNHNNGDQQMEDQRAQDASNIQETLSALLEFIQTNIIPTLN